jgi:hypothetical protein
MGRKRKQFYNIIKTTATRINQGKILLKTIELELNTALTLKKIFYLFFSLKRDSISPSTDFLMKSPKKQHCFTKKVFKEKKTFIDHTNEKKSQKVDLK